MKAYIIASLVSLLTIFNVNGQIEEFLGIVDVDGCDFEDTCLWIQINPSPENIWQIGEPQQDILNEAHSPTHVIMTDTIADYPTNNLSSFEFQVSDDGGMLFNRIVSFWHKIDSDTLKDGGYIEFSYDGGENWYNVLEHQALFPDVDFYSENLYGEDDTLIGGINGFSGTSTEWTRTRLQWIWYYPVRMDFDTLSLRFNFMSDAIETAKEGWMIDDIGVHYVEMGGSVENGTKNEVNMNIHPNPCGVHTVLTFNTSNCLNGDILVTAMDGRVVKTISKIQSMEQILITESLPNGLYLVSLVKNGQVLERERLVVNN
jgi:hypothetical protein